MRSTHRFAFVAGAIGLVVGLVLCSAAAARGSAGQGAGSWTLRGFGAWVHSNGDSYPFGTTDIEGMPLPYAPRFTLEDGDGAGLSLEYRVTRRLGIEALAILANLESEFRLRPLDPPGPEDVDTRDVESDVFGVGLNLHLAPAGRRFDVYVGPLVAVVQYDDFRGEAGGITFASRVDDDTALGFTLGADVFLGTSGRWAATAAVRQLWSKALHGSSDRGIDVDPLIVSLGVARCWGGS